MRSSSMIAGPISSISCFSTKRVDGVLLMLCRFFFFDAELAPVKSNNFRQFDCFSQDGLFLFLANACRRAET